MTLSDQKSHAYCWQVAPPQVCKVIARDARKVDSPARIFLQIVQIEIMPNSSDLRSNYGKSTDLSFHPLGGAQDDLRPARSEMSTHGKLTKTEQRLLQCVY